MDFKSINVEMTPELFERSIKGSPKEAIKELIWNACDADAKNIKVLFGYVGLAGAETVSDVFVKDDGHGIPFDLVSEYFGKYGRSQKTYSDKSPSGRIYHGKLGQGRYKSLAIGNFIYWKTTYCADDGKLYTYEIRIDADSQMDVSFSETHELSSENHSGTVVHIHGIPDDRINTVSKLTENADMLPELLATFAPYLLAYSDISINYNGVAIRPETQIEKQAEKELVFEEEGKAPIKARAKAIRWKQSFFSKLYICGNSGVVYEEQDYTLLKRNATSVYLLGEYFEKMHRESTLVIGLADPVYVYFDDETRKFAREFTQEQELNDATAEIQRIKDEGAYPFVGEPADAVAKAEQSVFDVLAVEVNRAVPQLKASHTQTKKLTYRLIKEAINTNPASIKTILTEVFNLTQKQQDDLAELLSHTHLPEIMDIAKTVNDRLTFIYMLDQIVYNDSVGRPIKERTQFHRLLLKELWIFGEKYALGTSDKSLKNLLVEHIRCLGRDELIPEIPPEAVEDLTRIPDICLFEQICSSYEHFEHLVIELKRPTLTLRMEELDQIRNYALTTAKNPLFDKSRTKWHFILLGQKFNDDVTETLKNEVVGDGNYYNAGNISISVLMWSSIIQDNKLKYEFLRRKLNHQLSDDPNFAMDYLMTKHAELFPAVKKAEA
ncbi:MAG: ATP-binding protein [Clostridiaceae bacterium]|nr:ATP-binding protein [Clostridiaceae bacterium]